MDDHPRGRWPAAPVIYEIYPRSFRDSTGSGEGDLRGIIAGLDHVAALGVDAIWIAPFFPSPMVDGGYDVIDHCDVDPRFGTLEDFDALVDRATELGLAVMIDQVLNHSSDRHAWFQRASDGDDECARFFVWRDPKPDGTPPNNWQSFFAGPAWRWNHKRRQYYLHQFLPEQPCFDMRQPDVQQMHRDEMRFWMDRGVTGFRLDVVTAYLVDPDLRDNPPADAATQAASAVPPFNPYSMQDHRYDLLPGDGAGYARLLRDWAGPETFLLGEINTGNSSVEVARAFTSPDALDAAYVTDVPEAQGAPEVVADVLRRDDGARALAWWMSSHDQPRPAATPALGRLYALLNAVMPGPMMIYQGEELALPQPHLERHEVTDPFDLTYWPDGPGREGARVPLPWTEAGPARGFTEGTPWLPMRWPEGASVEAGGLQGALDFFKRAIAFRKEQGLGRHSVENVRVDQQALHLTLRVSGAFWTAIFNHGDASVACPEHAPEISSGTVSGGRLAAQSGAVWKG